MTAIEKLKSALAMIDVDIRTRQEQVKDTNAYAYALGALETRVRDALSDLKRERSGPRISTMLAMSPAGEWWIVTMHDGEPHSARHPGSGQVLERVHRDTFVRWGSDDPMEVLDAVTKMWRPTNG